MAFFVTLTVLAGVGIIRRGRWQDYLLTGLLAGLAISTKQNVLVVLAPLAAHLSNPRRTRLMDLRLAAMGVCILAGFVLGSPYAVINFHSFLQEGVGPQIHAYGGAPSLAALRRTLPAFLAYFARASQGQDWFVFPHTAMGLLPAIAALAGMVAGFRWDRRLHLYLLSFPELYFLFMSSQREFTLRNLVPVLPFAALFAAVGCIGTWRLLQARWPLVQAPWARALAGLALVALLAAPGRDAAVLGWTLGHKPDTRTTAVEWLRQHVPPRTPIALERELRWHIPDQQRPFVLRFPPRDTKLDWYREQHIDFAVVGSQSALRSLPAVAVFPRPMYLGPERPYPVIDPPQYVVRLR